MASTLKFRNPESTNDLCLSSQKNKNGTPFPYSEIQLFFQPRLDIVNALVAPILLRITDQS